jgi:hypothetical protein
MTSLTRTPSISLFEKLGTQLDELWEKHDYDERAFPTLAAGILREAQIHRQITGVDVVRWLLSARDVPHQDDIEAAFGEPPVTVYHGRRFFIQVLFWTEGDTSIHRHAFSGAFVVLDGLTLHVTHDFQCRRRVNSRLLLGDLRPNAASLLAPGDVTEIDHDLIHSTFHLETPSATVVVRSYFDSEVAIQYDYLSPSIAYDPYFKDPLTARRIQALRFLQRTKQPGHIQHAADLVANSDLHTAWEVLVEVYHHLGAAARMPILDALRTRHGTAALDLTAALNAHLRVRKLQWVRKHVSDPTERFFLALLQNVKYRETIEVLARQRYAETAPRERISGWLEALAGTGVTADLARRTASEVVLAMFGKNGVPTTLRDLFAPVRIDAGASAQPGPSIPIPELAGSFDG